jgi:preprotein translocase subunit YajC
MMNLLAELLKSVPLAHAQAAASGESPNLMMQLFPIAAMIFIFYFLMIRPQVKNQKIKAQFLSQLKRGDEVLTSSGIFGTIEGLTDKFVTLEIADGVRIKILRSKVAGSTKEVKND